MSVLDSVSPGDAELALKAYKSLRPNQSISVSGFWDAEHQRYEREWKEAHDQPRVERAYHVLSLLGYARQMSPYYYSLIDSKITPDIVMRSLLNRVHAETKKTLNSYRRREFFARALFWLAVSFGAVFLVASSLSLVSASAYSQFAAIVFLALFFGSFGMEARSSRFWDRHGLSNEKELAVSLVDAYDLYMNPEKDETAKAAEKTRGVSQILRATSEATRWSTVGQERAQLFKIGEDMNTKVIPAMMDKKNASIGEILAHLACLFFQSSPASMNRAPKVYQGLRSPDKREIPAPIPVTIRLRKTISDPIIRTLIAVVFSGIVTYALISLGIALTNVPFPPTSTNLLAAALATTALTAVIRYLLPFQSRHEF